MFCRKCGQEIPDDSVYCVKCGTKVDSKETKTIKDKFAENGVSSKADDNAENMQAKRLGIIIGIVAVVVVLVMVVAVKLSNQSKKAQVEPWNETSRYSNNVKDIESVSKNIEKIIELDTNAVDSGAEDLERAQTEHEIIRGLEEIYNSFFCSASVEEDEFDAYKRKVRLQFYTDKEKELLIEYIKNDVDETMRDALIDFYELE